jgi:hypothetical protein
MNTTSLFVELIVIGMGAVTWVALLVFSFFGYTWAPIEKLFSIAFFVPTISFIYVLGIITDRVADTWFEKFWSSTLRNKWFTTINEYYRSRRQIYTGSERLGDLLEYGRSRMRICRGWAFNSALILVSFNLFMAIGSPYFANKTLVWVVGSLAMALLAYGAFFSWFNLSVAEYRKVKQHADFVSQRPAAHRHRGGRGGSGGGSRDQNREQKR